VLDQFWAYPPSFTDRGWLRESKRPFKPRR
jgi:hypothetical protein